MPAGGSRPFRAPAGVPHVIAEGGRSWAGASVQLITDAPAQLYGLRGRGRIEAGGAADLVLFDLDTVGPGEAEVRFDMPAGGSRLFSAPTGVEHVIVNGDETWTGGKH